MEMLRSYLKWRFLYIAWLLLLSVSILKGSTLEGAEQTSDKVFRLEDKTRPIRSSSSTKAQQLSTLHKGETYRVLDEVKDSKDKNLTWLKLSIPTIADDAWVGPEKSKVLSEEQFKEIEHFLDLRGEIRAKQAFLVASAKPDTPVAIFPVEIILITGDYQVSTRQLGTLEQPNDKKSFELPAEFSNKDRVIILINGKQILSNRQWVQLEKETPILTSLPAEVFISPYTIGEIEVAVSIKSVEQILNLEYQGSDLISLIPIAHPILGDNILRFRLNADEWRQHAKRTRPIEGKLLYNTKKGKSGEGDIKIFVKEQSSFLAMIRYLLPPFILFLVGALAIVGTLFFLLKIYPKFDFEIAFAQLEKYLLDIKDSLKSFLNKMEQEPRQREIPSEGQLPVNTLQRVREQWEKQKRILELELSQLREAASKEKGRVRQAEEYISQMKTKHEEESTRLEREKKELAQRAEDLEASFKQCQQAALDFKDRFRQAEEGNRQLETIHKEELSRIGEEKAQVEQRLETVKTERDRLIKSYVFVKVDSQPVLEVMRREMKEFTQRAIMLQRILQNLDLKSCPAASAVRQLLYAHVERFSWDWINESIGHLNELMTEGRSAFHSLVAKVGGGQTLSRDDCRRYLSEAFYDYAIKERWDHVLHGLQRFYKLGYIVELSGNDLANYERAVTDLQHQEKAIHEALQQLDIFPLSISFLMPVDERLVSYVVYSEEEVIEDYYPLWNNRQSQRRGLILDATSWGYLNREGKLWGDQKARLIMSK